MLFRIEVDIGEPEKENRGKDGKWKEREKWQQEIRWEKDVEKVTVKTKWSLVFRYADSQSCIAQFEKEKKRKVWKKYK